jgi:DNA polymerase III delta prime subunit
MATGYPTLYINCSDETGVDVIREKISDFCSSVSVLDNALGSTKVIILDEVDGVSGAFFNAFRATIEKFAKNSRFIATCNYVTKIPDAIQSRFKMINFDFVDKHEASEVREEWKRRMALIFKKIGVETEDTILESFVDRNFPDMRSALNQIQSIQLQGATILTNELVKISSYSFEDLYKMLIKEGDAYENYKFIVSEYQSMVDDVMASLSKEFIEWLSTNHPQHCNKIPLILIAGAESQRDRHFAIDPVSTLLALCFKIQKFITTK